MDIVKRYSIVIQESKKNCDNTFTDLLQFFIFLHNTKVKASLRQWTFRASSWIFTGLDNFGRFNKLTRPFSRWQQNNIIHPGLIDFRGRYGTNGRLRLITIVRALLRRADFLSGEGLTRAVALGFGRENNCSYSFYFGLQASRMGK